ncbi:hypothetical protein B296_00012654 [Ensete ventricosum]|uniref:Uncharacterized protein n=1 Tax=Ensete ventricosum TaxID=4639 RepID=A0A427B921_ENSVE|nr:hypothetical protein B296_00012654 [Ensete ventricosum]
MRSRSYSIFRYKSCSHQLMPPFLLLPHLVILSSHPPLLMEIVYVSGSTSGASSESPGNGLLSSGNSRLIFERLISSLIPATR